MFGFITAIAALGSLLALVGVPALGLAKGPPPLLSRAAAVFLGAGVLVLVAYVASEDAYRDNGISRWGAYDARGSVYLAIALSALSISLLVLGSRRSHDGRRVLAGAGLVSSLAAFAAVWIAALLHTVNN